MTSRTIKKNIYFYRVDIGLDPAGQDIPFPARAIFQEIQNEIANRPGRIYVNQANSGYAIKCTIDQVSPRPRIALGKIRRENLPRQDRLGVVTDLEIPHDAGLLEESHIVFFDNNIVGVEFNFYAPRITALRTYFKELLGTRHFDKIDFHQLLNQDAVEKLNDLGELTLFRLQIDPAFADEIQDIDESLAQAFRAAGEAGGSQEVELVLRNTSRDRTASLLEDFKQKVKALVSRPQVIGNAKKLEVKGQNEQTNRSETINLLEDKLIVSKEIVQQNSRSRAVLSESAFQAIEEAESEKHDELLYATGISFLDAGQ